MSAPSEIVRKEEDKKTKKPLTDEQVLDMFVTLARTHEWPAKKQSK